MEFPCIYWSTTVKMNLLARWVLVHSYLYYEMDYSVVQDSRYDANSKQLLDMIKEDITSWKRSRYYYAMKEFDGSTGFGFYQKLNTKDHQAVTLDAAILRDRF